MKVVKKNKKHIKGKKCKCHKCGSKLRYLHSDIKMRSASYKGYVDCVRTIICPVCGEVLILDPVPAITY